MADGSWWSTGPEERPCPSPEASPSTIGHQDISHISTVHREVLHHSLFNRGSMMDVCNDSVDRV